MLITYIDLIYKRAPLVIFALEISTKVYLLFINGCHNHVAF